MPRNSGGLMSCKIAVIARGQFLRDAEHLVERRLRHRAASAHQLEHIGIALLRHDGGARGELLRQAHEAELLGVEQQQIGRETPHVLGEQRDLEQQLRLGLAARQLHGGDRLVRDLESRGARRVDSRLTSRFGVPYPAAEPSGFLPRGASPAAGPRASSRISAAKPSAHSATVLGIACCMWV